MKPRPDLPQALAASVGLRVDRIDTPALVVDLDAMERNIARMKALGPEERKGLFPYLFG